MLQSTHFLVKWSHKNINNLSSRIFKRKQHNVATASCTENIAKSALCTEWNQAKSFAEIPKESCFKFIRNILPGGKYFNKDPNALLLAIHRDFGNLFIMPSFCGRPAKLLTFNPTDFEYVFRNDGIWPNRPGAEILGHYREKFRADFFEGVEGVISTQGEKWCSFRSVVNPLLMQSKNIKLYLKKLAEVNMEFVEIIRSLRDPQTLEMPANFQELINRWTLESVAVVALDKQLGFLKDAHANNETTKFFNDLSDYFRLSYRLDFLPSIWRYYPTSDYKRIMQTLDSLQMFALRYIKEAIERLEVERSNGIERLEHEKSVLEKLLDIDKKIAAVMAMDLLMAGVDTTTTAFTGIMLCLAKSAEKQQKLREEVMRVLPNKNSVFTESSLHNMPYLRACIKEGLRMYPLVSANGRVVQKDVVLSGFRVPKGTDVTLVHLPLLRNEKYFSRPHDYLPERWLRADKPKAAVDKCSYAANTALKTNNPFIYLPFGFGARSCMGRRIAELELEMGIARLVRNFKIEFNYSTENAFKCLLINVPNMPLKFKFTDIEDK